MARSVKNNYIYFHINPLKSEIFYVGKGVNNRAYVKYGRNKHWNNIVNKYGLIVDIIATNLTDYQAKELEKKYIKKIGRKDLNKGSLVNMTNGGDGLFGVKNKLSNETKDKISKSLKGRVFSESHRKKISESSKGRKCSSEALLNMSKSQMGHSRKWKVKPGKWSDARIEAHNNKKLNKDKNG